MAPPANIGQLQGENLLIGVGTVPHLPLNQNIAGLSIKELQVALLKASFMVTGAPMTISHFNCFASVGGNFEIAFSNDFAVASNGAAWSIPDSLILRF